MVREEFDIKLGAKPPVLFHMLGNCLSYRDEHGRVDWFEEKP